MRLFRRKLDTATTPDATLADISTGPAQEQVADGADDASIAPEPMAHGVDQPESTGSQAALAAQAPAEPAILAEPMKVAWSELSAGRAGAAVLAFEAASRADPTNSQAHFGVALAERMRGADQQAIAALERVLQIDPTSAQAHALLGAILAKAGDMSGAEQAFRAAISHDPAQFQTRLQLADLLFRMQREEDSIAEAQQAVAFAPNNAAVQTHLGHSLARAGRLDAARAAFTAAIGRDGALAAAHAGLANVLARQGEVGSAVEHAGIAVQLAPRDARLLATLGYLRLLKGEPQAAREAYAAASELEPGYGGAHLGLANALEQLGDLAGALQAAEHGAQSAPDDEQLRAKLAGLRVRQSGPAEISPAMERTLAATTAGMKPNLGAPIYDTYAFLLDHPEHQSFKNILRKIEYRSNAFSQTTYEQSRGQSFASYEDAYRDWVTFGRGEGLSYAPGKDTLLKIILKVKDEPHLIIKWIEYHAAIVGFHNLIILDCGSTDAYYLRALDDYKDKLLILNYDDYYDTIHDTRLNYDFYQMLADNCKYLTVIDADEFLFGCQDDTISGSNVPSILRRGDATIFAGTWFPNVIPPQGVGTIIDWTQPIAFSLEHQDLELGTLAGKAIVKSELATTVRHVGHNLHGTEVLSHLNPASFGQIGLLHLSRLGTEINKARSLKHLRAKQIVPDGCPVETIEGLLRTGLAENRYPPIAAHYAKIFLGLVNGPRAATHYFETSILFDNRIETNPGVSQAITAFNFDDVVSLAKRRQDEPRPQP